MERFELDKWSQYKGIYIEEKQEIKSREEKGETTDLDKFAFRR